MSAEELPGVLLQAIWPPHPPHLGSVTAFAQHTSFLWTAFSNGQIVRWDFEEEGHGDGNNLQSGGNVAPPEPSLLLCGHSGAVAVLHAWEEEGGSSLLLSIDVQGEARLWNAQDGSCLLRKELPFRPGRASAAVPGGAYIVVSHGLPDAHIPPQQPAQPAPPGADWDGLDAAAEFQLALVHVASLSLAGRLLPASMHSLARYFDGGPVPGDPTTGCELLSLGVAGATQDGHPPVILGVARQASLITWDLPRSLWGGLLPSPRRTGERVSPHQRHAPPLRHPVAGSPKSPARPITPHPLSGTLASASFWADGLSLLLVAGSGWLYLESDMAQFEGGPQHLVPRDAGDAAELRGPPLCGTEGPSAVAGGPAATWARVPGLGADTGSAAAEEGRRDSGARAGCHPLAELQGGCLIRPRGSPAEEVEGRGSNPAIVIWDGRGQAALLQLLHTRGHRLLGTSPPVGIGDFPVTTASQPTPANAASPLTVDILSFVTCPGNFLARIASLGSLCAPADVAVTCFLAPELAEPSGGTPGGLPGLADSTHTGRPPRGGLVPRGESRLFDVWWAQAPAGPESYVAGSGNARTGTERFLDGGEESACDETVGNLTISITAGGDALVPGYLVQGFSSGRILVVPLSLAAVLHAASWHAAGGTARLAKTGSLALASRPSLTWLRGHGAAICCLVEHCSLPDQVLLSGATDGTVCGWRMSGEQAATSPLFCLNLHTGPVTQLLAAAGGGRQAWGTCFASASEDGSVCITGLAAPFESRSLPGYPGGVPCRLSWVPTLGYLACLFKLGPTAAGQAPEPACVTVVWDAHSCKQDRVVAGAKGELLMANFETLASGPGTASHPQPRYIHVAPGCTAVPPSISLLEVDVSGLIRMKPDALMSNQPLAPVAKPAQGTRSPKRPGTPVFPSTAAAAAGAQGAPLPAIAVKKTSRPGGGEAAALATALAVLHIWGIDDVADKQMIGMVASLGLLRWSHSGTGESSSRPPGGMAQEQLRIAPSMGLFQGALPSDAFSASNPASGAVTIQWPNLIRPGPPGSPLSGVPTGVPPGVPTSSCDAQPATPTGAAAPAAAGPASAGALGAPEGGTVTRRYPAWRYGLLRGSRQYVALRTLAMVALAKRLMGRAHVTEQLGNCCSLLVALYAVSLREALPAMAVPKLEVFASLWQDSRSSVREAARSLLSAATDPSSYRLHGPVPFQHLLLLFRNGVQPATVSPRQLLDPAVEAGEWEMEAVLAAGAACAFHPRAMPDQLLEVVVPKLVAAVLAVPQPHSAVAAALLADGLAGFASPRWRRHLPDIPPFLTQLLTLSEKFGSGVAISSASPAAPDPDQARPAWQRSTTMKAPAKDAREEAARKLRRAPTAPALAALPEVQGEALPGSAGDGSQTPPDVASAQAEGSDGAERREGQGEGQMHRSPSSVEMRAAISKALSSPRPATRALKAGSASSTALDAGSTSSDTGGQPEETRSEGLSALDRKRALQMQMQEVVGWRDGVAGLLSGLALADLPLFLHVVGHRLGGAAPPESGSHVMLLEAIASLTVSRVGQAALAPHLQLVASVLLRGLDPSNMALRRTCIQVVSTAVKELCLRFPMVAYSSTSLQLAVGRAPRVPGDHVPAESEIPAASLEPIAIFDMETGHKKRSLQCRPKGPGETEAAVDEVSAVAFSPSGDTLAGFTADGTTLKVWPLVAAWTQRLQRSSPVVLPSKVVKIPIQVSTRGRSRLMGGPDLGWSLRWESSSIITVLHDSQAVTVHL